MRIKKGDKVTHLGKERKVLDVYVSDLDDLGERPLLLLEDLALIVPADEVQTINVPTKASEVIARMIAELRPRAEADSYSGSWSSAAGSKIMVLEEALEAVVVWENETTAG